ncbi:hypothetical protein FRB95_012373 [Tulasnella sp. JGI-2019a]|nr:hypothetical protein FRB95_012373 [Tulasnella sp. JGI-2019a]
MVAFTAAFALELKAVIFSLIRLSCLTLVLVLVFFVTVIDPCIFVIVTATLGVTISLLFTPFGFGFGSFVLVRYLSGTSTSILFLKCRSFRAFFVGRWNRVMIYLVQCKVLWLLGIIAPTGSRVASFVFVSRLLERE